MMAVWTPGSYLIREYERHVENVAATGADGAPADSQQDRKESMERSRLAAPQTIS